MKGTEEGLKKAVLFIYSCRWVVVGKHDLREGHSGRIQRHEPKPGEVEDSGSRRKS